MKKIYLVKAMRQDESKVVFIDEIFTNKKLAEAYVQYWDKNKNHPFMYWIDEREICKADYRDLLKVNY